MSEEISEVVLDRMARERRVSTGELAALKLALQKQKSKDIAKHLDISESAARKRLGEVYRKFDIRGRGPGKLASLEQKLVEQATDPKSPYSAVSRSAAPLFDPSFAAAASVSGTTHAAIARSTKTIYHWDEAPKVGLFQGREDAIRTLSDWISIPAIAPKLLAICGIGGIGKTCLSLKLAEAVGQNFQQVVWLPVKKDQPPEDFLRSLLIILQANASSKIALRRSNRSYSSVSRQAQNQKEASNSASTKDETFGLESSPLKGQHVPVESVARLIQQIVLHLSQQRCLVILDGFERIFKSEGTSASSEGKRAPTFHVSRQQQASAYKPGFEAYGDLLEAIKDSARFRPSEKASKSASTEQSSCLILTSREKPRELLVEVFDRAVKLYTLQGLADVDAIAVIKKFHLQGTAADRREFVRRYSGHPMALLLAANTVQDVFSGSIQNFLAQDISVFDDLRSVLKDQFKRLPLVEKEAIYWLAINHKPCSLEELKADIVHKDHKANLLYTLRSLGRRSLIKVIRYQGYGGVQYSLHPVVLEYVLDRFVREMFYDLVKGDLTSFNSFALLKADAEERLRRLQATRIVTPILDRLKNYCKGAASAEAHLNQRLCEFRDQNPARLGYAGGNFVNLLAQLSAGNLSKKDFSRLAIWQAYLPGVRLNESNFSFCQLDRSVFTEALSDVLAVSFNSPSWRSASQLPLLAAGDANGVVHLWMTQSERGIGSQTGQPIDPVIDQTIDQRPDQKLGQWLAHSGWVRALSFIPHTNCLVTGGDDNQIKLWRLLAHPQKATMPAELVWSQTAQDWVRAIAVSPDGSILATGGDDKVMLYRAGDGHEIGAIHHSAMRTLAFSPNGEWLAGCGDDAVIRLWAIASIEETTSEIQPVLTLSGHTDLVHALCFSPDSTRLVSGGNDGSIVVWAVNYGADWISGEKRHTFEPPGDRISTLAISPDGRFLASGGDEAQLRLWNFETFKPVAGISTDRSRLWSVAFQQQGSRLLLGAGGERQQLMLWQVATDDADSQGISTAEEGLAAETEVRSLRTYRGYTRGIRTLAYLGDRRLIGGGDSGDLWVWDAQTGDRTATLSLHQGRIWSVAVDAQKKRIASASDDYTVRLWDATTGQCLTTLSGHNSWVRAVSFSNHGRYLASAGDDCTVRIWNTVSGICSKVLDRASHWIRTVSFDPANARYVVSGGDARVVTRWDRKENTYEALAHHEHRICSVAHSPDGRLIASGSDDATVVVWDVKNKEVVHHFKQPRLGVKSVSFSPNGRYLAAGGEDQIVYVWDLNQSDPNQYCLKLRPNDYTGLAGGVRSVVFSPDSQFVLSGGLDEMIRKGAMSQMAELSEIGELDEGVLEPLIERDRPYENLEIKDVTGLSGLQVANLLSLGAVNSRKSLLS